MLYNKNEVRKVSRKPILHKVHKNWIVISSALLLALAGGAAVSSQTSANADNNNQSNVQQNEQDFLNNVDQNSNITTNNNSTIHSLVGNSLVNAPASSAASSKASAKSASSASSQWYWKWNGGSAQSYYAGASSEANLASNENKIVNSYVQSVNAKFPSATSSLNASLGNAKSVLNNDKSLAASYSAIANNSNYSSEVGSLAASAGMTSSAYIQSVEYVAGSYNSAVKNDSVLNSEMTSVDSYANILESIANGNDAVKAEYSNAANSANASAYNASTVYSNAIANLNAYNSNVAGSKGLALAEQTALNDSVEDAGTVQSIANALGVNSASISSEVRNLATAGQPISRWSKTVAASNAFVVSGSTSGANSDGKSKIASFTADHFNPTVSAYSNGDGTTTDIVSFDYVNTANGSVGFTKSNGAIYDYDQSDPSIVRVVSNTAVMYSYASENAAYGKNNARYNSASSAANSASVAYADAETTANYYNILEDAANTNNGDEALDFIFGTNNYGDNNNHKRLMDPSTDAGANAGETALDNLNGAYITPGHHAEGNVGIKSDVAASALADDVFGSVASNGSYGSLSSNTRSALASAVNDDFTYQYTNNNSAENVRNSLDSIASSGTTTANLKTALNSSVASDVVNPLYDDDFNYIDNGSKVVSDIADGSFKAQFGALNTDFNGYEKGLDGSIAANTKTSLSNEVASFSTEFSNMSANSASGESFANNSTNINRLGNLLYVLANDSGETQLPSTDKASTLFDDVQITSNVANDNNIAHTLYDVAYTNGDNGYDATDAEAALGNFTVNVNNGNGLRNALLNVENDPHFTSLDNATPGTDDKVINALNNDFTGAGAEHYAPSYYGYFNDGAINSLANSAASAYTVESNASSAYANTTDANVALAPYYAASYAGDIKPDEAAVTTASNARENFYVQHAGSKYASAEYQASSASNASVNDAALAQAYGINVYNNTPKYIRAIRGVRVHSDTNFGSKADKVMGNIPAGDEMTVEGIGLDAHGALRYNIYYKGANYFVSGNANYVVPTFLAAENNVSIVLNKPAKVYNSVNFNSKTATGKVLNANAQVSGDIIRMDNFNDGFTRVKLSDGNYITANTNYVAKVANNDDVQNNINGQNINHYINNANNTDNNNDAPITWGI